MFDEDRFLEDTLFHIASFLGARDLLRFALACKRFGARTLGAPACRSEAQDACNEFADDAVRAEMLSMAQESSRRWLVARSQHERSWAPRRGRESWLGMMWEVEELLQPLRFHWANAGIELTENGTEATRIRTTEQSFEDFKIVTAASQVMMRAGRHFAEFTVLKGEMAMFGVIRPGTDLARNPWPGTKQAKQHAQHLARLRCFFEAREKTRCGACGQRLRAPTRCNLLSCWRCKGDVWAQDHPAPVARAEGTPAINMPMDSKVQDGHCLYMPATGAYINHRPNFHDWVGMQGAMPGDKIGMLLDLEQGSMTVYKNDVLLGVMVSSGLSGEYCWATAMVIFESVRITGPHEAPPPPTEEELAAARQRAVEAADNDEDDDDDDEDDD